MDHKVKGKNHYDMIIDELPYDDNSIDEIYMSHVIEHCPMYLIIKVLRRLYKKLKEDGKIRIVTPDLKLWVEAYLRGDPKEFERFKKYFSFNSLEKYGVGAAFTAVFVSVGTDMYLFDRDKKKELVGLAHCAAYDFESLSAILKDVGFTNIEKSKHDNKIDTNFVVNSLYVNAKKGVK